MSKYPTEITKEILEGISHVSTKTILIDIADTKIEARDLEKEVSAYKLLAETGVGTPRNKMNSFMLSAKQDELQKRIDFIAFLTAVLEARYSEGQQ